MGMKSTDQFDPSTEKQVPVEQFDFNFDLWAKAVKQQMLQALQSRSEFTEIQNNLEDLPDFLDDESE